MIREKIFSVKKNKMRIRKEILLKRDTVVYREKRRKQAMKKLELSLVKETRKCRRKT